jgi:hypothetical protein
MAAMEPGARYGMLVAVQQVGHKVRGGHKRAIWLFRCDCGKEVTRTSDSIKESHMCSCGCYKPPGRAEKQKRVVVEKPAPTPGARLVHERHVEGHSFGYAPSNLCSLLEYV